MVNYLSTNEVQNKTHAMYFLSSPMINLRCDTHMTSTLRGVGGGENEIIIGCRGVEG